MPKKLTQEEFISSAIEIHGDRYSYHLVNYVNTDTNVNVWCNHCEKIFLVTPYKHTKRKQGCRACGDMRNAEKFRMKPEEFLIKANKKHNFKFTYYDINFKNGNGKIKWLCSECGTIKEQNVKQHIAGSGCPNCYNKKLREQSNTYKYADWEIMGNKSKNFDSFKCYEIECTSKTSNEIFYKIGKTFLPLVKRFSPTLYPFTYKIIKIHTGTAQEMSELETELKSKNKEFKYIPEIPFSGQYECFFKLLD